MPIAGVGGQAAIKMSSVQPTLYHEQRDDASAHKQTPAARYFVMIAVHAYRCRYVLNLSDLDALGKYDIVRSARQSKETAAADLG